MKKRMSTAALGLRMTWKWVLLAVAAVCAAQLWVFHGSRIYWNDSLGWSNNFEWILDEYYVGFIGIMGFLLILNVVGVGSGTGKSRTVYTLRRLRISENEITVQWALVFAGYFVFYWAVQVGLMLWLFSRFEWAWELTGLDLFIAVHRSGYFHMLLPLSEPWGFVRNISLCLGWGAMGSLVARQIRHGGRPIVGVIALLVATYLMLPKEMATVQADILFPVAMALAVTGQIFSNREVERNEG